MTAPRPGVPHQAPRGHRWVPAVAEDAEVVTETQGRWAGAATLKCGVRAANPRKNNNCNAGAVAVVDGQLRCPNHLDGRWVDAGIVFCWALEPTEEEDR